MDNNLTPRALRAIEKRKKAEQLLAAARQLEDRERTVERKRETSAKIVLGGLVLAAIRNQNLSQADFQGLLLPGLADRDRPRVAKVIPMGWIQETP